MWRTFGVVAERPSCNAFLATTRAVLGPFGQNICATNHFPGYHDLRALVIWGRKDRMIPVRHAEEKVGILPMAELEIFDHAGHFPHLDDPRGFYYRLDAFLQAGLAQAQTTGGTRAPVVIEGAGAAS